MTNSTHIDNWFRILLSLLHLLYGSDAFDARSFSERVIGSFMLAGYADPRTMVRFSVKRLSNDFRRLYNMRFLSRKRAERKVKTRRGMECFRGYSYLYRISNQGMSYLAGTADISEGFTCPLESSVMAL